MKELIKDTLSQIIGGVIVLLITTLVNNSKQFSDEQKYIFTITLLSLFILYLLYSFFNYNYIKKLANIVGYMIVDQYELITLQKDGSFTWKTTYKIKSKKNFFNIHATELNLFGDSHLENRNTKIESSTNLQHISHEVLTKSDQSFFLNVKFNPGLKVNEEITYEVSNSSESGILMYYEDVLRQIENKNWIFDRPFEFIGIGIKEPIKKLTIHVDFPKDYKTESDEYVDVRLPMATQKITKEIERLISSNSFEYELSTDNKLSLKLVVNNPVFGLRYYLKWIPPKKKNYS